MGKYNLGILSAFSGKVGTIVGSSWRGIRYMRSLSAKRGNANASEKLLEQQAKFSLITDFLKPVKALLEIGFKNYAVGKTGYNSAHSYNLKNALAGTMPNLEIDFSMVLVSRGDLPLTTAISAASATAGRLDLTWTDNTGKGKAKAGDQLMLVVFCPALAEASYSVADATRSEGSLQYILPADFSRENAEVYVGWLSEDGKDVSNSKYLGRIAIA